MNILIYHTLEDVLGGAELVLLHVMNYFLEKPENRVTIIGFKAPDIDKMESFCGLRFPRDRISSIQVEIPAILKKRPHTLPRLRTAILQRKTKQIAKNYDLCVSTYNEIDFGRRGIQYIHMPTFVSYDLLLKYGIAKKDSLLGRYAFLGGLYLAFSMLLAGNSKKRMEKNMTLTNSHFMKGVIAEEFDIDAEVVYPSLLDFNEECSNDKNTRVSRIACIGRINEDKNTLALVDLYAQIHRRTAALGLMIAGKIGDEEYFNAVKNRTMALNLPVDFKTDLSRTEIESLLKTSLFFINPKYCEHFGIATLEALRAGCLPFVHQSGGSVEIIPAPELQYTNAQDLSTKVERLVNDHSLREKLLEQLAEHRKKFSVEQFYREFDAAVVKFCTEEKIKKSA